MTTYPAENIVILYAVLAATQFYLAYLAAIGHLYRPGRVFLTLRYATLAASFLLLALFTVQPPIIDLVQYRWWLRSVYIAYALLALLQIAGYWRSLIRATRAQGGLRAG